MKPLTAILVYIPDTKTFIDQFWGLYQSALVGKNKGVFEFVIICQADAIKKLPSEYCKFFIRDEISLQDKYRIKYNNEPYRMINSMQHFVDAEIVQFLRENYQFCFRLDVDTFITPSAHLLRAGHREVKIGQGGYYGDEPKKHLKDHCDKLGLSYPHDYPIGSTWFGNTEDVLAVGEAAFRHCEYLINNDEVFLVEEGNWPSWFVGVMLLYAGHLAFSEKEDIIVTPFKFDIGSAGEGTIDGVFTLHCWHSEEFFSKFVFADGGYEGLLPEEWRKTRKVSDFAYMCAFHGQANRRSRYLYEDEEDIVSNIPISINLERQNLKIDIFKTGRVNIQVGDSYGEGRPLKPIELQPFLSEIYDKIHALDCPVKQTEMIPVAIKLKQYLN